MYKYILILLMLVSSATQAQLFPRAVQWWHLSDGARDSLWANQYIDSLVQVRTEFLDSLLVQAQRVVQYKDTTALKAAAFDSAGFVVNLKQLSSANTNGGGQFETRPAAEYSVDNVMVFTSGNASYEWVRKELINRQYVSPYHAGAMGDNSNDDTAEMQAAEAAAVALDLPLCLGDGTFKMTSPLSLTAANDNGFIMYGNGVGRTKLSFVGCNGIETAATQQDNVVLKDFEIERTVADADTGVIWQTMSGGKIENIRIDNFRIGVHTTTVEDNRFENVGGTGGAYGIYFTGNSNGNTVIGGGFTGDSIAYVSNASHGNVIEGIDIGNQPVGIKMTNISECVVIGGQFESHDSTALIAENNCIIEVYGTKFQRGSAGIIGETWGTSEIRLYGATRSGYGASDSLFRQQNTSSLIRWYGQTRGYTIFSHITSASVNLPVNELINVRPSNFSTGSRGRLYSLLRYTGDAGTDALVYPLEISDTKSFQAYLTDGIDWRYDSNGLDSTLAVRSDRLRYIFGSASGTTSAGDSTEISVWVDTLGVDNIYHVSGSVDRTSPDATPMDAYITQLSNTVATGEVKLLIWHKSDTGGGIAYRVNYFIIAKAKTTGNW